MSQLVFWYQPGRLPTVYHFCRGTEEPLDLEVPVRIHWQFLVLQVVSAAAHIGINIRIKFLSCTQVPSTGDSSYSLSHFQRSISLAFIESRAISDLASTLIGIVLLALVAVLTTAVNMDGLREDWHILRICILNLFFPCVLPLTQFAIHYFRHGPLRRTLIREIKSNFNAPNPCYVCSTWDMLNLIAV